MDDRDVFGETVEAPSQPDLGAEDRAGLPSPGDVVLDGKYRVEKVIGVGGMGAVMLATHVALGQRAAFKFLLPSVAREHPEASERFVREARAVCNLRGDHVVRVVDVGRLEGGTAYILMEHLEGADLADHLAKVGPLPIETAVDLVLESCVAIAEAHAVGIVHRDLKPSNLFLAQRPDGSTILKVLDFGISKNVGPDGADVRDTLTRPGSVLGSPTYMSPEQIRGSRSVDARADVWALGVILHELLTGHPMFSGETYSAICAAVASDPATPLRCVLPGAPDALEAALLQSVEKAPDRRFASVAELARAIAPFGGTSAGSLALRAARLLRTSDAAVEVPRPASSQGRITAPSTLSGIPAPARSRALGRVLVAPLAVAVLVLGATAIVSLRRAPEPPASPGASLSAPAAAGAASSLAPATSPGTERGQDAEQAGAGRPEAAAAAPSAPSFRSPGLVPGPGVGRSRTPRATAPPAGPSASAAPSRRSESELLDHRF